MYRLFSCLIVGVGLFLGASWLSTHHSSAGPAEEPVSTVYVSHMGKWYHRDKCYYLARSKTEITLAEAKQRGLRPCKLCRPPDVKDQK